MKKSVLIVIYIILILGILLALTKPVSADTKFSAVLTTDMQTISQDINEVTVFIRLGDFVSDGILGYEATLEYDENVFGNASIEGLNGWDNPSYDSTTNKFLSTTENAVGGTNIAKITLELKDNITVDTTQVSINNFTITDGPDNTDTLNLQITYTFENNNDNVNDDNPEENPPTNEIDDNEEVNNDSPENEITNEIGNIIIGNEESENLVSNVVSTNEQKDNTVATGSIPQTGGFSIIIGIGIIAVIGIFSYIRFSNIQVK